MENTTENRDWYFFDAAGQTLGRLSTQIADLLRGKNKVDFRPNKDGGDFVVVVNADKFVLTGKKMDQKRYYKHTGYLGNLKTDTVSELMAKHPGDVIKRAVQGMLPHNKLQDKFMARLKIYAGAEHPHNNAKFKNS